MSLSGDLPASTSQSSGDRMLLVGCNAIVFTSSMCIMILELVAARLVATHLGSSLYTWTSVIGVILAGISLGNYIGGRIADRFAPRRILGWLFLGASAASLSVIFLNQMMDSVGRPEIFSWPMWILMCVTCIFFLPAFVLGTISPVVAKMALERSHRTGLTVGNIYAWGAAGSIVGTFLTGFVLISLIGTRGIVCSVSGGLATLGLLLILRFRSRGALFTICWILVVVAVSVPATGSWFSARRMGLRLGLRYDEFGQFHYESNYYTIRIINVPDYVMHDVRALILDNMLHTLVATDDPKRLVGGYELTFAAVTSRLVPNDQPVKALIIGGGGFSFPRFLEATYPCKRIDVAEIDPAVKRAAQDKLALPPDDKTLIETHLMDARNYVEDRVRQNGRTGQPVKYNLIYCDAFNRYSVPYHLTTKEFNERISRLLAPDGVYLVKVIDIYREGLARFLGAYVGTALQTFPNVYVFTDSEPGPTGGRQLFIVVCAKRSLDLKELGHREGDREYYGTLFASAEEGRRLGEMETLLARGRQVILTDDYAPVDNLLAPLTRRN